MDTKKSIAARFLRAGLAASLAAGLLAGCQAADSPAPPRARVYATAQGQVLSPASKAEPQAIVARFLAERGRGDAAAGLRITHENHRADLGLVHLRLRQEVDGLRVAGAYVKATVNERGELLHLIENLAPATDKVPAAPSITERAALERALAFLGHGLMKTPSELGRRGNVTLFDRGAFFHEEPRVERVVVATVDGRLGTGFEVETWTQARNQLHRTLVDGAGRVVKDELRTQNDSYNVFTEDPGKTPQAIVQGPGAGNVESPAGWLGTGSQTSINISGNNVNAYLDADANNRADRGGTAVADGSFLTSASLAEPPSTTQNRAVAVQNLFYLNNVVHDVLYRHGFTEAAGNFQVNNFGKGGAGNDPVLAEAQDGSGTDNANFSTPSDGRKPRMQMYLWTGPGPTHEAVVGASIYPGAGAEFGPAFTTTGTTAPLALMSPADGCTSATASLSGKLAVVDRGTCSFDVKVKNAQLAGAVAVIVANHAAGGDTYFTMASSGTKNVRIPSMLVGYTDGGLIKGAAGASATARKKAVQPLQLDGDLDSDIVFHEYGHGLTWRMIGGMSGPLAGAIGEGASDTVAFLINGDDRVGEYAYSNPLGIRRAPYAGYPRTYSAVTGAEVHDDGEIYAAAMWRAKELFDAAGAGDALFVLFVDGMNYTPVTPAYEDMRDGMLQSAVNLGLGAHQCLIWQAFAQFGIGFGAKGLVTGTTSVSITESFALPTSCQ